MNIKKYVVVSFIICSLFLSGLVSILLVQFIARAERI